MGQAIPIRGGEGDGSMFFVGDTVVIADAMDAVTSAPIDLGNGDNRVFAYWTFLGHDQVTKEPKAVTVVMPLDMLRALPPAAKKLYLGVPLVLRTVGGGPGGDGIEEITRALPEG